MSEEFKPQMLKWVKENTDKIKSSVISSARIEPKFSREELENQETREAIVKNIKKLTEQIEKGEEIEIPDDQNDFESKIKKEYIN